MNIDELKNRIIVKIDNIETDNELVFYMSDGYIYTMYHEQDCCEYVYLEDVDGDLNDLLHSPVLIAEEIQGEIPSDFKEDEHESYTFTFYKLATIKGYVTLRWYGESNGYYSEGVNIKKHFDIETVRNIKFDILGLSQKQSGTL